MEGSIRIARAATAALLLATAARAAGADLRVSANAGAGFAYDQTYFALGGRVGYGLGFGFELTVGGDYWTGATPSIFKLSPGLTWYAPIPLLRPYVGGFYDHWFVGNGFPDEDALGVRGGITILSVGPASAGVGVAYERRMSCSRDCDTWWPEASAGFAF